MHPALIPAGLCYKTGALILGVFLLFGCIHGLWTRKDIYDQGSARWMVTSQLIGILISLVLLAYGLGLIDFPAWFYERVHFVM
jgi:uncharacterized membrane protein HdeD (DUF308 family)